MDSKFQRWQDKTLSQFTYTINLFLGISIAIIGFQFSLLLNNDFTPLCFGKFYFSTSLILMLISSGLGCICVINRLKDFRITAKITRLKAKDNGNKLKELRRNSDNLGERTWLIFWWQFGLFWGGIFFLALSLITIYSYKLI